MPPEDLSCQSSKRVVGTLKGSSARGLTAVFGTLLTVSHLLDESGLGGSAALGDLLGQRIDKCIGGGLKDNRARHGFQREPDLCGA